MKQEKYFNIQLRNKLPEFGFLKLNLAKIRKYEPCFNERISTDQKRVDRIKEFGETP